MVTQRLTRLAIAFAVAFLVDPATALGAGPVPEAWLGDAPRFDAPQDISGWRLRELPTEAPLTRQAVVDLYNNVYLLG